MFQWERACLSESQGDPCTDEVIVSSVVESLATSNIELDIVVNKIGETTVIILLHPLGIGTAWIQSIVLCISSQLIGERVAGRP